MSVKKFEQFTVIVTGSDNEESWIIKHRPQVVTVPNVINSYAGLLGEVTGSYNHRKSKQAGFLRYYRQHKSMVR